MIPNPKRGIGLELYVQNKPMLELISCLHVPPPKYPLYHVSKSPLTKSPAKWKLAKSSEDEWQQDTVLTEPNVERISFSPTTDGCLSAIYTLIEEDLSKLKEGEVLTLYVMRYKPNKKDKVILPKDLTDRMLVWDAHVTQEHWVCNSVSVESHGSIVIPWNWKCEWTKTYPYNILGFESAKGTYEVPTGITHRVV